MSKHSEVSTFELRKLRRYLLFRYADTLGEAAKHHRIGEEIDEIGRELNRRTGETKYKL